MVSLDPLTVKYTVNEGVKWSDGVQIGAADLILSWGAQSANFNDEEAQLDDDGNLLPQRRRGLRQGRPVAEPDQGLPDDRRRRPVGHLRLVAVLPRLPDRQPGDSDTAGTLVPAHVVGARRRWASTDPEAANEGVINAFKNNDKTALKPIADFWNTGFDTDQLPSDPSLYLSSGPYKVTSYAQRANLTLERNPDYTWGPIPSVDKINYSIIGDPTAAVQALTNEEIDVISPQATADIYQAVSGLKDRGIEVKTGDGGTYEHVDLVFANGGPFDPAKYGGDADKALKVRTGVPQDHPADRHPGSADQADQPRRGAA